MTGRFWTHCSQLSRTRPTLTTHDQFDLIGAGLEFRGQSERVAGLTHTHIPPCMYMYACRDIHTHARAVHPTYGVSASDKSSSSAIDRGAKGSSEHVGLTGHSTGVRAKIVIVVQWEHRDLRAHDGKKTTRMVCRAFAWRDRESARASERGGSDIRQWAQATDVRRCGMRAREREKDIYIPREAC